MCPSKPPLSPLVCTLPARTCTETPATGNLKEATPPQVSANHREAHVALLLWLCCSALVPHQLEPSGQHQGISVCGSGADASDTWGWVVFGRPSLPISMGSLSHREAPGRTSWQLFQVEWPRERPPRTVALSRLNGRENGRPGQHAQCPSNATPHNAWHIT